MLETLRIVYPPPCPLKKKQREKMRERLNKRIDLLKVNQLENNIELLNEILKDGIKIYEIN